MNTKDLDFVKLVFQLTSSLREDISTLHKIGDGHAADIIDDRLTTFNKRLKRLLDFCDDVGSYH